jgi:hypothetical protein
LYLTSGLNEVATVGSNLGTMRAEHFSVKFLLWSEATDSITQAFFYLSNLNCDVAIKASPTIKKVILADIGRIPKNIKLALVNAKMIPTIN